MLSEQDLNVLHREAEKDTVGNYALLRAIDTAMDLRNVLEEIIFWERDSRPSLGDPSFREFVLTKLAEVGIK
jgi:hypothetical protein